MHNSQITILGAGVMGGLFARQVIKHKLCSPEDLLLIDQDADKLATLRAELKCKTSSTYEGISTTTILLIATKPQDFPTAAAAIAPHLMAKTLIISIMAGVLCSTLRDHLRGDASLVRVMPNIAAQVGEGMSGWFAENITTEEQNFVEKLLSTTGKHLRVTEEHILDAITAVSGSGPAYVFYIMEHMMEQSVSMGTSKEQARLLVAQTFRGALALVEHESASIGELRERVTSKGGTTAAALATFDKYNVGTGIQSGMQKAQQRARELSS